MENNHEKWMKEALKLAKISFENNEVPVGAVVVKNGIILGRGYNLTNSTKKTSNHAEIIAIDNAGKFLEEWRLVDCDMYVTLEPCMMCVGAINISRIKKLVYGTKNNKLGAIKYINKKINVISGILEEKCSNILSDFFKDLRKLK